MQAIRTTSRRLAALLLPAALLLALPAAVAADEGPAAPDWNLRCADGEQISFHDALAEGPVLVSFWALWCKPCLKELPHIDQLARDFAGRLTVLAVNIDNSRSVAKVRPFLRSKGYEVTVPLDTSGDVKRLLQVGNMVPFLVLYDSTGQEVYRHTGYKMGDEIELRRHVDALLGAARVEEDLETPAVGNEG